MKFSITKNDKSTFWDEVIIGVLCLVCLAGGILLIVYKPSLGVMDQNAMVVIGVLMTIVGCMFVPGLIYRLFTNERTKK